MRLKACRCFSAGQRTCKWWLASSGASALLSSQMGVVEAYRGAGSRPADPEFAGGVGGGVDDEALRGHIVCRLPSMQVMTNRSYMPAPLTALY